jgi:hypothetical protein
LAYVWLLPGIALAGDRVHQTPVVTDLVLAKANRASALSAKGWVVSEGTPKCKNTHLLPARAERGPK